MGYNQRYLPVRFGLLTDVNYMMTYHAGTCSDRMGCKPYVDADYCRIYPDNMKYWCPKSCFNCKLYTNYQLFIQIHSFNCWLVPFLSVFLSSFFSFSFLFHFYCLVNDGSFLLLAGNVWTPKLSVTWDGTLQNHWCRSMSDTTQ